MGQSCVYHQLQAGKNSWIQVGATWQCEINYGSVMGISKFKSSILKFLIKIDFALIKAFNLLH